jgi:hypothetical protein
MEYLDKHREQLDAELRGMIEKWKQAGKPLLPDAPEGHRMVDCTRTVGGILQVNGFKDFLANYRSVRAACDPTGQSLGILAAAYPGKEMTAREWAALAVTQGLDNLFSPGSRGRDKVLSREREMGWKLKAFIDHTVEFVTEDGGRLRFKLHKDKRRWEKGLDPHFRYWFAPEDEATKDAVKELAASEVSTNGSSHRCIVCNEPSRAVLGTGKKQVHYCLEHYQEKQDDLDQYRPEPVQAPTPAAPAAPKQEGLDQYQPEEIPARMEEASA